MYPVELETKDATESNTYASYQDFYIGTEVNFILYILVKVPFKFQLLDECHCWWTRKSPRTNAAKFYGRLLLIRSALRASKFSVLKLIEIVILWVYYTSACGFSLLRFDTFLALLFNFFNYSVWLRITDKGSIPEMRIQSILLIRSDLKWHTHLSRSIFLNSIYDKLDGFNFHITNFPFLTRNIPTSHAYGVFISQLIRYARACSLYGCFILRVTRF